MSVFKCKMCGGDISFEQGVSVGVCEFCGTKQTLPRLDSDRKENLYDRANHFRRNNDYDKAANIYEQILNEEPTDAEAYWSLVLCQYGIEYVEDPVTHKRVPTMNRAQFTSIFDDENYKYAIQYSDSLQRTIYEKEAAAINEIQKGILSISQKEDPFDVFICYKETDANGRRTQDSVLANDLYHQLLQEGFKVFFSRITLEDKLGTAYEPYIFAALNSAKVMVVLGTKPEYFNAVWVKNEWSRYLGLVKNSNGKKILIPAYKDMDPYDLPDEFSHLQAQDMSKLGFMQDLIHGIKKMARTDEPKPVVKEAVKEVVKEPQVNSSVGSLLKRVEIFLEDGEWKEANTYCEKVLDIEPENAKAYLGKLMVECEVSYIDLLERNEKPLDEYTSYRKVIRYADNELKTKLERYNNGIKECIESKLYDEAVIAMKLSHNEKGYLLAEGLFIKLTGFKDSDVLAKRCHDEAEEIRKDDIYQSAKLQMDRNNVIGYEAALTLFNNLCDWKDSQELLEVCKKKIKELKAKEETVRLEREQQAEEMRIATKKRIKKEKKICAIVVVIIVFVVVFIKVIIPKQKLNEAMELIELGHYEKAYLLLEKIGKSDVIVSNKYDRALALLESGNHEAAYILLEEIGKIDLVKKNKYNRAVALIESGDYEAAYILLEEIGKSLAAVKSRYNKAAELIECRDYEGAYILLDGLDYMDSANKRKMIEESDAWIRICPIGESVFFGSYEQDNNAANGKEDIEWKLLAREDNRVLVISRYALDCQPYNMSPINITWENCTLRKWLNSTFLIDAFSDEERGMIPMVSVGAEKNPIYSTKTNNSTTDQVFLLNIWESNKYFGSAGDRKCQGTAYCYEQGALKDSNANDYCRFWLRSSGSSLYEAAYVDTFGDIVSSGGEVNSSGYGVRPALWINL